MLITSIADLRERARRRVPRAIFDYADRGSYDEVTLARNRDDLDGLYPIAEYETMPDPPNALELLKEAEQNGVLRRALGTVEWTHESIRDYFVSQ